MCLVQGGGGTQDAHLEAQLLAGRKLLLSTIGQVAGVEFERGWGGVSWEK